MSYDFKLDGLAEAIKKLDKIKGRGYLRAVMTAAAEDVKAWLAVYPQASQANDANGRQWYERGWGEHWRMKDGSIHGKQSSETMGKRWSIWVSPDALTSKIGNNASYVRFAQDEKKQTGFHKRRGWRTVQDALKEKGPVVLDKIKKAISQAIGG